MAAFLAKGYVQVPGGMRARRISPSGPEGINVSPLNPEEWWTEDQMHALEQEQKANKELEKQTIGLAEAFGQLINSALSSATSIEQVAQNLVRGLGQMGNRMIVESMGGIGGYIAGGLFGFGMNMLATSLFRRDQKLPIRDDAMDTRIINWDEAYISFAAVRDKSELSYSRKWRESWAAAAARG